MCVPITRDLSQLLGSETTRATLLFSMEQGVIQGWVGLDPVEENAVAAKLKQVRYSRNTRGCENARCRPLFEPCLRFKSSKMIVCDFI